MTTIVADNPVNVSLPRFYATYYNFTTHLPQIYHGHL